MDQPSRNFLLQRTTRRLVPAGLARYSPLSAALTFRLAGAMTGETMAGHSVKISVETYAHVVLAASAAGQTVSQWMEAASEAALTRQNDAVRLSRFREAQVRAADRREGAPLARDFGLPSYHQ